jgi:iron complex transport system permease protein
METPIVLKHQTQTTETRKLLLIMSGLLLVLFLISIASLAFGAREVQIEEIIGFFLDPARTDIGVVVVGRRFLRTLFGIFAGACLGVSGALMKSITRNPIADPGILGVNTGASFAVVLGIHYFSLSTGFQYILFALAGASGVTFLVFSLSSFGQTGGTPLKLILAGAAITAALNSLMSAILLPQVNVLNEFRFWQVGSLGTVNQAQLILLFVIGFPVLLAAMLLSSKLNALALGDEFAQALGIPVTQTRFLFAGISVFLTGIITAFAGPIGFIGLLASHLVQLLLGPDQRKVIPLSGLAGAVFLIASDVFGRSILRPRELEVGVVTAFIGAPLLIWIATQTKGRSH